MTPTGPFATTVRVFALSVSGGIGLTITVTVLLTPIAVLTVRVTPSCSAKPVTRIVFPEITGVTKPAGVAVAVRILS
jgi:hypothetical protein